MSDHADLPTTATTKVLKRELAARRRPDVGNVSSVWCAKPRGNPVQAGAVRAERPYARKSQPGLIPR